MSDFPHTDPWSDEVDDVELTDEHQDEQEKEKPATNWREAQNVDELVQSYDGDAVSGGQVNSWAVDVQDAFSERQDQLAEAQRRQDELVQSYEQERPDWAGAKSLAEMTALYQKQGGAVSSDFTITEDVDGQLQVYERG